MEARSVFPGVLDDLPGRVADPAGGRRFEGVLTVVGDEPGARGKRRLPSLFYGKAAMYAGRDLGKVRERLHRMASVAAGSPVKPHFLLTPCRLGGTFGLYGRHVFNRAPYRLQLQRHGFEFADDPVVTLGADGGWTTEAWGPIPPSFVVLSINEPGSNAVRAMTGARMLFHLGSYHLGPLTPERLALLARASSSLVGIGAAEPGALAEHLRSAAPA